MANSVMLDLLEKIANGALDEQPAEHREYLAALLERAAARLRDPQPKPIKQ